MEWQPIDEYYEVSDNGEVRHAEDGRLVGQWLNDNGYYLVRLSRPRRMLRVSRLVATAFLPNPFSLPVVNHLDFDRANNAATNLEWCTQRHNLNHSRVLGRMKIDYWKGKRGPNAILTDEEAAEIRRRYAEGGISHSELGRLAGVSKRTVGRIVSGATYA